MYDKTEFGDKTECGEGEAMILDADIECEGVEEKLNE